MLFFIVMRQRPRSPLFPYTTLFRSDPVHPWQWYAGVFYLGVLRSTDFGYSFIPVASGITGPIGRTAVALSPDRKSTRLNSSHRCISYAVFCLKKKIQEAADASRPAR